MHETRHLEYVFACLPSVAYLAFECELCCVSVGLKTRELGSRVHPSSLEHASVARTVALARVASGQGGCSARKPCGLETSSRDAQVALPEESASMPLSRLKLGRPSCGDEIGVLFGEHGVSKRCESITIPYARRL